LPVSFVSASALSARADALSGMRTCETAATIARPSISAE
jgi:hypothetical protein